MNALAGDQSDEARLQPTTELVLPAPAPTVHGHCSWCKVEVVVPDGPPRLRLHQLLKLPCPHKPGYLHWIWVTDAPDVHYQVPQSVKRQLQRPVNPWEMWHKLELEIGQAANRVSNLALLLATSDDLNPEESGARQLRQNLEDLRDAADLALRVLVEGAEQPEDQP